MSLFKYFKVVPKNEPAAPAAPATVKNVATPVVVKDESDDEEFDLDEFDMADIMQLPGMGDDTAPNGEGSDDNDDDDDDEMKGENQGMLYLDGDDGNMDAIDRGEYIARKVKLTAEALGIETSAITYKDLLFSLMENSPLKVKVGNFLDAEVPEPEHSVVPIDAFAQKKDRTEWDTHSLAIDEMWEKFQKKVEQIGEGSVNIPAMAKPSGPLNARMTFVWHYPTQNSTNTEYSFTMDPGSCILGLQRVVENLFLYFFEANGPIGQDRPPRRCPHPGLDPIPGHIQAQRRPTQL